MSKHLFRLLFVSLLLTGCSMQQQSGSESFSAMRQAQAEHLKSAQDLLSIPAENMTVKNQLLAADQLIQAGMTDNAQALISSIKDVPSHVEPLHQFVRAELAFATGQEKMAHRLLAYSGTRPSGDIGLDERWLRLRTQTASRTGNPKDGVKAMIDLAAVQPKHAPALERQIWDTLSRINTPTLKQMDPRDGSELSGWLGLASITRQFEVSTGRLGRAMSVWHKEFPNHPAARFVPTDNVENAPFRQVAILLPLSGAHSEMGRAIERGIMAGYYSSSHKPVLKVYDSAATEVTVLMDQALNDGADFIIGPLLKNNVQAIANLPARRVSKPMLALNRVGDANNDNLWQFGLDPETEGKLVANYAAQNGYERAIIIRQAGNLGERLSQSFKDEWQHHGRVVEEVTLGSASSFAADVRNVLNIEASQQRAGDVKKILGTKVDFEGRRRTDIDLIYLALENDKARQIKPLLDFYYAKDVTTMAPPSIFSGVLSVKQDRDLNGVIFCDMPWLIDSTHPDQELRRELKKAYPDGFAKHARLYALGLDAFRISEQYARMMAFGHLGISGATGTLTLNNNHQIERKLPFAKMKSGIPELVSG